MLLKHTPNGFCHTQGTKRVFSLQPMIKAWLAGYNRQVFIPGIENTHSHTYNTHTQIGSLKQLDCMHHSKKKKRERERDTCFYMLWGKTSETCCHGNAVWEQMECLRIACRDVFGPLCARGNQMMLSKCVYQDVAHLIINYK